MLLEGVILSVGSSSSTAHLCRKRETTLMKSIYMGNDLFLNAESKIEEMISNSKQVW